MNELKKNKTLAEFMGGIYEHHPLLGDGYRFSDDDKDNYRYGSSVSFISFKSLGYDINWNHLISVCTKIRVTVDEPTDVDGKIMYNNLFDGLRDCIGIGITFLEAHRFVEWLNKQNNK